MGVNRPSRGRGPSSSSLGVGVRRTSYPSGPWVDAYGNPARSPNASYSAPDPTPTKKAKKAMTGGNPDPDNWKIVKAKEHGKYLVLMMQYPDCTNYEGKKILVFEDVTLVDLVNQKQIDPHFFPANLKVKSPVARFEPTDRGWIMAEAFCQTMNGINRNK
jgi:hypothetical protein